LKQTGAWLRVQAQLEFGAAHQNSGCRAAPRVGAAAADGHEPLLAQIRKLTQRARIPLQPPGAITQAPPDAATPYGLPAGIWRCCDWSRGTHQRAGRCRADRAGGERFTMGSPPSAHPPA
jgi:hypothetical protein